MKPKLALLAVIAMTSLQASPIYVVTQDVTQPGTLNQIGLLNAATGAVTGVQTITDGIGNNLMMFDIAVDMMGDIWGLDWQRRLHKINPATGVATMFAATLNGLPAGSNLNGLDFDPLTGLLYFSSNDASTTSRLYRTDLSTCSGSACTLTNAASSPLTQGSGGDIAFHNGQLYFGGEAGVVYRMTLDGLGLWQLAPSGVNTGTLTAGGIGVVIKGMVSNGSSLFAGVGINPITPGFVPPGHALLQIDPTTLAVLGGPTYLTGTVHTTAGLGANNAVPEPATLVSTISAICLLYVLRKRAGKEVHTRPE